MKPTYLYILFLLFCLPFNMFAQDTSSTKLMWGIEGGINSLRINSSRGGSFDIGLFGTDSDITMERPGSSYGYQFHAHAKYRFDRVLEFVGAVGLTKVKSKTVKMTESHGHILGFPTSSTSWEEVNLEYLYLNVKAIARLNWTKKNTLHSQPNLFFDFGLVTQLPLVNQAEYEYRVKDDNSRNESGSLDGKLANLYLGLGLHASEHLDITLGLMTPRFESSDGRYTYNAMLTSLSLNGYF